jgi:menaquinol-cytochrome c reductase cytochrome b/c subunit
MDLFSETAGQKKVEVTMVEPNSEGAKILQKATCISCHGADLKGGIGPKLLGIGDKLDEKAIMTIIKKGQNAMPAQYDANISAGLKAADIDKLAKWLSIQKAPVTE